MQPNAGRLRVPDWRVWLENVKRRAFPVNSIFSGVQLSLDE
jgi:hypothetical protein